MTNKVGIGVISVNRPEFFKECIKTLPLADHVVEVICGEKDYFSGKNEVIYTKRIDNVAKNKNKALKFLIEERNCDHVFLCEDDIKFEDANLCDKYIKTAETSGIWHLNYGGHGFYNRNQQTQEPIVKKVIDYGDVKVDLYHNILGAWSYYRKECIERVGYMDENYQNAMEHVEHTYKIYKDCKKHPPFWYFADIHESYNYIKDIKENFEGSVIRKDQHEWNKNLINACQFFKTQHGYMPMNIPDVGIDTVKRELQEIYRWKR
jgi:GT2 family glycosyltransferase